MKGVINSLRKSFENGGQYINMWVTPATVALAIKLKKNIAHLKENVSAILSGIGIGVVFHTVIICPAQPDVPVQ